MDRARRRAGRRRRIQGPDGALLQGRNRSQENTVQSRSHGRVWPHANRPQAEGARPFAEVKAEIETRLKQQEPRSGEKDGPRKLELSPRAEMRAQVVAPRIRRWRSRRLSPDAQRRILGADAEKLRFTFERTRGAGLRIYRVSRRSGEPRTGGERLRTGQRTPACRSPAILGVDRERARARQSRINRPTWKRVGHAATSPSRPT